jgi:hypothetical protein
MSTRRLALLASLALAAPAAADTLVYSTNFENGVGPEWSVSTNTTATNFSRFLGRFSNSTGVNLTLPAYVPPPGVIVPTGSGSGGAGGGNSTPTGAGGSGMPYMLVFDFYCLDSWDGDSSGYGPDLFAVMANGAVLFNHTFANQHEYQSYAHQPTEGRSHLGFNAAFVDSIYRDIAIPFDPGAAETLTLRFYGSTMQGPADESWGIDNVRLLYNPVPTPGSATLLAIGGILIARRKR